MVCLILLQLLAFLLPSVSPLVIPERAQAARSRLVEALSSPSGKLTLSPEIVIPEPSNPTAILLQSSLITTMSEKMRTEAKANAAFVSGGVPAMKTFCNEQELARGNFPGPLPVIYCDKVDDMATVAEAGAEGILVAVCDGNKISNVDDLSSDTSWAEECKKAVENGLQPIPEIAIDEETAESWKGDEMEALVSKIAEITGEDPVSVLFSVTVPFPEDSDGNGEVGQEEGEADITIPQVPKGLGKRIPILGSITAKAGEGRMGQESARFKSAGFTGAVLRRNCVPVISMSQDLEYLTNFWSVCIGDLKSTKSKTFNFRSRNWMDKSVPLEWAKYQKDVVESGALGDPMDNVPMGLDPNSGDYKGF